MESEHSENSGTASSGVWNTWVRGTVWFRDLIPTELPWGDESILPEVPENARSSYGARVGVPSTIAGERYKPGEIVVVETEKDFRRLLPDLSGATAIIFPWYEKMVPASLLAPHQSRIDLKRYRQEVGARFLRSLVITAGLIAVAFTIPSLLIMALLAAMVYGLPSLIESGTAWLRRVDRLSVDDLNRRLVNFEFFRLWILGRPTLFLKVALGVLIAVLAGQMLVGTPRSIDAAALVKQRVFRDGEWWRIVTTGLMHGNVVHILFNGMALYSLGRVLAALVSPSFLTFIFLFTVVSGSLASLWFGPAGSSVGASGGILGCLGFLLVATEKFKASLPGFLRANLIQSTFLVAIVGLLGSQFIDNAAHAGGFLGGIVLGFLFYPWMRLASTTEPLLLRVLSWGSLAILLGGVGKIGWELWKISPGG